MAQKLLPPPRVNLDTPSVLAILEAAEACFAQGGFHATSMRLIAQRAGVSKALIHYHFDSKESLFLEMLAWLYRTLAADVEAVALHEATPGLEAAQRAFAALTVAMERLAPLMPVFAEVGAAALEHSALRARTRTLLAETRTLVEQSIEHILGPHGVARLPTPPAALATLVHSCLHGIALTALYDEVSIEDQMDTFRALILAALGGGAADETSPNRREAP